MAVFVLLLISIYDMLDHPSVHVCKKQLSERSLTGVPLPLDVSAFQSLLWWQDCVRDGHLCDM